MTERAPGLDAPRNNGGCFNCGSQHHFAYACPEPVRKEPHGAGFFRQRQAERTIQSGGGHGSESSKPKGGLVVTRYGPPPPQFPPPANAWGPGGPYPPPATIPPPNPYGQQPPLPYPPPNPPQPPYPPPYPPASAGYGPPAPPSTAPGPAYGQYGQAPYQPPPPAPSSYGPPGSYAPVAPYASGSYPQPYQPPQPVYPGAPPTGYAGPSPPAPPPPAFPPSYGAAVPPGPPPPPGAYPPPPHAPGYDPPAPYPNPYPPPQSSGWQQDPGGHGGQRQRDRRDRRNDRDKGSKNRHHRRDNDNHQRGRGQRRETSGQRPSSASRQRSPKPSTAGKDDKKEESKPGTPAVTKDVPHTKDEDGQDQEFLWDLEKAFVELATKPADPVGKPLAAEWNDDPTIPPAYNAKCIKTAFYDPDNPDAFLASVRDTKYWTDLTRDPIFRYRRGMVVVQFPGSHHEYFTYHCSRKTKAEWSKDRELIPAPSDATLNDTMKPRSTYRGLLQQREGDSPLRLVNGKRSCNEGDAYARDAKRPRTVVARDRSPSSRLPPRPSPRDLDLERDTWAPQPGETRADSPHRPYSRDEYSRSPGGYRLQSGDRLTPYNSAHRHDSGYHSAHSAEKSRQYREERANSHLSPPPSIRDRDRSRDRDRYHDREREQNRPRSPYSARPRTRSLSRSRSPPGADSDAESVMSDLEYELLGLERPKKKAEPQKSAIKKQRVKVNDAFSRRW